MREPRGGQRLQCVSILRSQFPYMEAGRRAPDREPVLEATWLAAIAAARGRAERLAIGGRSMGGRIASWVVADGAGVEALALFAYPLHPPGHRPIRHRGARGTPGIVTSTRTRTCGCT